MAVHKLDIDGLVAVENARNVSFNFLGSLLWFTITDSKLTREALEEAAREAGIESRYLPGVRSYKDAFRLASKAGECQGIQLSEDRELNILVRNVNNTGDVLIRHIVREIVQNRDRLEYKPVIELLLSPDGYLVVTYIHDDILDVESDAVAKIRREYQDRQDYVDGNQVRSMIQNILRDCSKVTVRESGGVYFVPDRYTPTVQALKALVKGLNGHYLDGGRSIFEHVPVVDAEEQRTMVQESLEEQVKRESAELLEEVGKAVKSNKPVTEHMSRRYMERARDLARLVAEYEELLAYRATSVKADLELVRAGVVNLLTAVNDAPVAQCEQQSLF